MDQAAHALITAGVSTAFYPLAYAKTLIQIGFEPLSPVQSTSVFGSKVLVYPNIFQYVGHIKRTDGWIGLYRGLTPKLLSTIVGTIVSNTVSHSLNGQTMYTELSDENEQQKKSSSDSVQLVPVSGVKKLLVDTMCESIARCAGTIISQPFYVVCVRSMCQFVGRETKYDTVIASFVEIKQQEGFLGLFSGLLPRLFCDLLTIWLANVVTYVVNNFVLSSTALSSTTSSSSQPTSKELHTYSNAFCQMAVSQLTYPFAVVSTVMAVNNSGLLAGSLSNGGVLYTGWIDCWNRLAQQSQLKRGSGFFWRVYKGPVQSSVDGRLVPVMQALF